MSRLLDHQDALDPPAVAAFQEQLVRAVGRQAFITYAVSAVIWLTAAPLVAARYHLVSPAGILLTPPIGSLPPVPAVAAAGVLAIAGVLWLWRSLGAHAAAEAMPEADSML